MDAVAARGGDSTWPKEGTRLKEGKVTSAEVEGTLEDSLDTKKGEMAEGKVLGTADKEEMEELGKRVEIQRSKGGLSDEEMLEESDKTVGE